MYPGLGLTEPTLPTPPPMPSTGDDLDALDDCGTNFPMVMFPVYFSLDSAFFDPKEGAPLAGSAAANGFVGGDVLVTVTSGASPIVYASAAMLGLDQLMPDRDDLDALVLAENGVTGYQRSLTPYDWLTGSPDMLLFSVRRASAIIGSLDSIFGLPIEEGDVLVPPVAGGNGNPGIFIAAERLGLRTLRAFDPCGDDLDALDHCTIKKLLAAEYCYGDGGLTPGCTTCPCGNDVAAGTKAGCMNSNGTGARLLVSGLACVSADTLRFEMTGGNPTTFGVLVGGANRLPLVGPCLPGSGVAAVALDGLRCIGGSLFRHGSRATDATGSIGVTNAGWGPPNGPAGGLLAQGGYTAGQTKQFQVFYRELATMVCMRGQNTSSAVQVIAVP